MEVYCGGLLQRLIVEGSCRGPIVEGLVTHGVLVQFGGLVTCGGFVQSFGGLVMHGGFVQSFGGLVTHGGFVQSFGGLVTHGGFVQFGGLVMCGSFVLCPIIRRLSHAWWLHSHNHKTHFLLHQ